MLARRLTRQHHRIQKLLGMKHSSKIQMPVGNLLYQKLVENGVKCAWIYSGGAVMPLVDSFYDKTTIKYYINTHVIFSFS